MIDLFVTLLLLVLLYALVLNSFAPADLLSGLLLSIALLLLARRYVFQHESLLRPHPLRRLLAFFPFSWAVLKETVAGTWRVLLILLRLRPLRKAGIVSVPMGERTRQGVLVTAYVMTFTPGSFLVDLDWDQREMFFHVLDATSPADIQLSFEQFYRRYQEPIFP